jgi:hypothetical protein
MQTFASATRSTLSPQPAVRTASRAAIRAILHRSVPTEKVAHGSLQRDILKRVFNGTVVNNSAESVTVWSSDDGLYTIAPGKSSGFFEDVDHIQDSRGIWYKIGWNTVTVDRDGVVSGFKCVVGGPGEDCPPEPGVGDFPLPSGSERLA